MSTSDHRHGAPGFTLVELLIVITIAGMIATLVGGIAVERLEKVRAQGEYLELERLAQGLSFRAFAAGRPIRIRGDGAALSWQTGAEPAHQRSLRFWFVTPAQEILIDGHGIAAPAFMAVAHRETLRRIALNDWLEHGR